MVMLVTSHATSTCSHVEEDSKLIRSCAIETSPVLRTRLYPMEGKFSCPEKGGEYREESSRDKWVSDILWNSAHVQDGVLHDYSGKRKLHISDQASYSIRSRPLNQPDRDQDTSKRFQKESPVSPQTSSRDQLQCKTSNDTLESQFQIEIKELISQLINQSKECQNEMRLLCQTAHHQQTAFIVQQTSIFRELHREMAAIKAKVVKSTEIVNVDNASCVQQALLSEKTTNQPENDTSNYSATIRLERPTFGSSSTSGGVSRLESNSVSLTTPTVTRLDRLASNDESSSISDDTDRQEMSSRASGIIGASNDI